MGFYLVKVAKPKRAFAPIKLTIKKAYSRGLTIDPHYDAAAALDKLSAEILKRVRAQIKQTVFSPAAKRRLSKALSTRIKAASLQVVVKDPLWGYLLGGQRKQQMKWLQKAAAPIPIVTESGKVIFRSATARSMADGRWIHPGRKPQDVVTVAVKEARAVIKKRLARELASQLRKQMGGW